MDYFLRFESAGIQYLIEQKNVEKVEINLNTLNNSGRIFHEKDVKHSDTFISGISVEKLGMIAKLLKDNKDSSIETPEISFDLTVFPELQIEKDIALGYSEGKGIIIDPKKVKLKDIRSVLYWPRQLVINVFGRDVIRIGDGSNSGREELSTDLARLFNTLAKFSC